MSKTCFISQIGWKTSLEVKKYTNRRKKGEMKREEIKKRFTEALPIEKSILLYIYIIQSY